MQREIFMRMTAFATVLAFVAAGASQAQSSEHCSQMGELAQEVMQLRQEEIPMSKVLDTIIEPTQPKQVQDLIRTVVVMAYQQPAMRAPENRRMQAAEFRNDIEVTCYTSQP